MAVYNRDWNRIFKKIRKGIIAGEVKPTTLAVSKWIGIPRMTLAQHLKQKLNITGKDLLSWTQDIHLREKEYVEEYQSTHIIHADGSQEENRLLWISKEDEKSPEGYLKAFGYDPELWEVKQAEATFWNGLQNIEKGGKVLEYKRCYLRVIPKIITGLTFKDIEEFFKDFDMHKPEVNKYIPDKTGITLEINLADLHVASKGVLESDKTITQKVEYTIREIQHRAKGQNITNILFVMGGDIFHFDGLKPYSSRGTLLDSDGTTYKQAFRLVTTLMIWVLIELNKIAPIEAIWIPGNHDKKFSFFLAMYLQAWFKDAKNIKIDCGDLERKWRKVGITVIGWTHGELAKKRITSWLQIEAREVWSFITVAEVHAFHFHSQKVVEENGVILRHLPSMVDTDDWHYVMGYVGALKTTQSFLWHPKKGLYGFWNIMI